MRNRHQTVKDKKVKGLPYGISSFEEVRNNDMYCVDKTMYLPTLERAGHFLFLIRPMRFGKSVFLSMMRACQLLRLEEV